MHKMDETYLITDMSEYFVDFLLNKNNKFRLNSHILQINIFTFIYFHLKAITKNQPLISKLIFILKTNT